MPTAYTDPQQIDTYLMAELVARGEHGIVGILTLDLFRIPTGVRAIIEDVVVDEDHRGHGIAEGLTRAAIARANAAAAKTVDLTSCPSRNAANRLYQKLGSSSGRATFIDSYWWSGKSPFEAFFPALFGAIDGDFPMPSSRGR
jgi:GNAT superfamily N-acetyltransferase